MQSNQNCGNCVHCYIPEDFLLGLSQPEFYCNKDKNKPLSGCVLSEPFNYYDKEKYDIQQNKWNTWAQKHKILPTEICDQFVKA